MRSALLLLLSLAGAACTETPTDIPPCVLPSDGCPVPDAAAEGATGAANDAQTFDEPAVSVPDGGLSD